MAPDAPCGVGGRYLRPWVWPRSSPAKQSGHGAFLTELRPSVALFLRFGGIDYDADEQAGDKLNALIVRVQAIAEPLRRRPACS